MYPTIGHKPFELPKTSPVFQGMMKGDQKWVFLPIFSNSQPSITKTARRALYFDRFSKFFQILVQNKILHQSKRLREVSENIAISTLHITYPYYNTIVVIIPLWFWNHCCLVWITRVLYIDITSKNTSVVNDSWKLKIDSQRMRKIDWSGAYTDLSAPRGC